METNATVDAILHGLEQSLPPTWARTQTPKLTGGIFAAQSLANYDSMGIGPPRAQLGKRVIYEKASFIAWLASKLRPADKKAA